MSLYNQMNGVSPVAVFVLPVLGKHPNEYPRFRDAFLGDPATEGTEGKLIVYTRTGGGNRETYAVENDAIRAMPGFRFDYDDDFDSTFANWVFDIPEQHAADVQLFMESNFGQISLAYRDMCAKTYPKIADKILEAFDVIVPG